MVTDTQRQFMEALDRAMRAMVAVMGEKDACSAALAVVLGHITDALGEHRARDLVIEVLDSHLARQAERNTRSF